MAKLELTDEIQTRICTSLELGNYLDDAAQAAGVPYATVSSWLYRAKSEDPPGRLAAFAEAVEQAKATARERLLGIISNHAIDDWKAGAWLAERLYPKRFPPPQVRVAVEEELNGVLDKLQRALDKETFAKVIEAIRAPEADRDEVSEATDTSAE